MEAEDLNKFVASPSLDILVEIYSRIGEPEGSEISS